MLPSEVAGGVVGTGVGTLPVAILVGTEAGTVTAESGTVAMDIGMEIMEIGTAVTGAGTASTSVPHGGGTRWARFPIGTIPMVTRATHP